MTDAAVPASIRAHPRLGDWVRVREAGRIELRSGKVELGQGISAALIKIASQALGVDPARIDLVGGDTRRSPDEGYTTGSQSIEVGGAAVRFACNVLRRHAAAEAARQFGAEAGRLRVAGGVFFHADASRGLSYATLAQALDLQSLRIDQPPAADALDATVIALADSAFARADLPHKLTGAGFVHDLQLDGMLHARVLRGPHPAARAEAVDAAALRALPGVQQLVQHGDFLALVGPVESAVAAAAQAAGRLVRWRVPPLPPCGETESLLTSQPTITSIAHQQGPLREPPPGQRRLTRRYSRPFIAHAAIGPSCAVAAPVLPGDTAEVTGASDGVRLTVWSHTQGVYPLRDQIALALGLPAAAVHVIHRPGAGCYGHNGADDAAFDAAYLAHALQAPVRVLWTRADELSVGPMGAASLVEIDAGLDAHGHISDWQVQVWSPTHLARPGWGPGINLLGAWALDPATPPPPPRDVPLPNGGGLRNAIPAYRVAALQVTQHLVTHTPVRVSALRSLGAHANVFAIESFMDELAELAGADPLAFRLAHLADPRASAVLEAVARRAGWAARGAGGEGRGLGLGYSRYKNKAGHMAVVLEVEVGESVRVHRVWAAADAGAIVHRDGLMNQIEGGIVQALSWSLKEAVRWGPGGVESASWDDYPILSFAELPEVHIELIDRPDEPSLGAGELAPGPIAGALGNAVAHALGLRARHLPLSAERLLALVHAEG